MNEKRKTSDRSRMKDLLSAGLEAVSPNASTELRIILPAIASRRGRASL